MRAALLVLGCWLYAVALDRWWQQRLQRRRSRSHASDGCVRAMRRDAMRARAEPPEIGQLDMIEVYRASTTGKAMLRSDRREAR